jgi:hypothetical protein
VRRVGAKVFVLADPTEPGGATPMHILDNDSAVLLWEVLAAAGERGATERELAAALEARFTVDSQRALADSRTFLEGLAGLGVARLSEP